MPRRRPPAQPSPETDVDEAASRLAKSIRPLAEELRALHAQAVAAYAPEVDAIIASRSHDEHRIERTLDGLLDFCGSDAALAEFKRLCRYYYGINPAAAARQVEWYWRFYGYPAGHPLAEQGET